LRRVGGGSTVGVEMNPIRVRVRVTVGVEMNPEILDLNHTLIFREVNIGLKSGSGLGFVSSSKLLGE